MNLTPVGGRVLLFSVTAFGSMAGIAVGFGLGSLLPGGDPNWIALGLGIALCSTGAMVSAGWVEYLRRAPHLSRVMGAAGIAGLLAPLLVLSWVPYTLAFPALALVIGGVTAWVDIRASQRSQWDG
ncbi:MAG: hypothetical protein R2737_08280 [Candidatus Nanopelagicales bacterium]